MTEIKKINLFLLVFLFAAGLINASDKIPSAMREMRGVWVATVDNIDWPSKPGLSVDEQKKEAIAILDKVKALNMNAVVLQVRPQADALYKSDLEPWSYYLTGEQGKAPEPFYDPLEFWIEESHARGIELHAWFNPYRAGHPAMKGAISEKSVIKAKAKLVRRLADTSYYWMDPAMKEVQDHSYAVIMDVVKRYDVDGIHFDDYFYPYAEYNKGKDFPDEETYKAYKAAGGKKERGDWRRDAVNKFVQRIYKGIKKQKPWVKFGISPFGIYRPGYPASVGSTFDQYSELYADAKLWLNKGWVDYLTPQIYWTIAKVKTSFPVLLGWWNSENTKKRNIWPGLYASIDKTPAGAPSETVNQIMVTRGMDPKSPGTVSFSMKAFMRDSSALAKAVKTGPFTTQALIPASPWLERKATLKAPVIKSEKKDSSLILSWSETGKNSPFLYVIYTKDGDKWTYEILPGKVNTITKKIAGTKITQIAITTVDKCGVESKKKFFAID